MIGSKNFHTEQGLYSLWVVKYFTLSKVYTHEGGILHTEQGLYS